MNYHLPHFPLAWPALALLALLPCCQPQAALPAQVQATPPAAQTAGRAPVDQPLHFNPDWTENSNPHPSARALRERAKEEALDGLALLDSLDRGSFNGQAVVTNSNEPVDHQSGNGPLIRYPNRAAYRAAIYRAVDSLRALEHLSLISH